jgi:hypothetical protein
MNTPTRRQPSQGRGLLTALAWLAAAAGAIAVLLISAATAEGGTYRVTQCNPTLGVGHGDLAFERTAQRYVSAAACREGRGLTVKNEGSRTPGGRWGAWTLRAPLGTALLEARTVVVGESGAGHVPELLIGKPGSEPTPFGRALGSAHTERWSGRGADSFQARLRCRRDGGCGSGPDALVRIRRLMLRLADRARPALEIGGPLAGDTTVRGAQELAASATDQGGGVSRLYLEVNDRPLASRRMDCAVKSRIALRTRPCPASAERTFVGRTDGGPFRQGRNRIRVCALDFALESERNRRCTSRGVRVDNLCPVDEGSEGARVRAHLRGLGQSGTIRQGERAIVDGRLLDDDGAGVAGAEVCVATRAKLAGATERVVATPRTGPDGRFSVRLGAGASREVRVAHWPDEVTVTERYLQLTVQARPGLRLRPRRTLHNGERLRFAVRLHGPAAAGRRVHLKARGGGRWFHVRSGRTNSSGLLRTRYRFRATTGERTYRFRAFVPRQEGYPFAGGRSAVRRAHVQG